VFQQTIIETQIYQDELRTAPTTKLTRVVVCLVVLR
jgi:hypothetical protein